MKMMHRGTWIIIIIICAKHLNTYPALHCGLCGFYATTLIQCINIANLCSKILTDNLLRTRAELHELSTNTHVPPCMNSHTHAWSHGNITHSYTKRRKCVTLERWKRSYSPPHTLLLLCLRFVFPFSAFPSFPR